MSRNDDQPDEEPIDLPAAERFATAFTDPAVGLPSPTVSFGNDSDLSVHRAMGTTTARSRVDITNVSYTEVMQPPFSQRILNCGRGGPPADRQILRSISFSLQPGECTVLLGGPRSGKTSLLDVLAGRQTKGVHGEISVDGAPPGASFQRLVSYVVQGDYHAPRLTVHETLEFSARCQMPVADSEAVRERVDAVLQLLGLTHAADTLVGGFGVPGVSGGERRRTSIGVEWVKAPKFFLLDEPTTGLDSGAAMNIGRCIRAISRTGTPVLCSLLQPSWELVSAFDKLLMLSDGGVVYWGPVGEALPYFARLGFRCPDNYSAAEFLSEVADHPEKFDQDPELAATRAIRTRKDLVREWNERAPARDASLPPPMLPSPAVTSLHTGHQAKESFARSPWRQYTLLMWRGYLLAKRDRWSLMQSIVADIILALLMGLLFFQLSNTQADSKAAFGLIWFLVARLSFESVATIPGPYMERPYVTAQRAANYYQVLPYTLSSLSLSFPIRIGQAMLFSTIAYWIAGLWQSAGHFFFMLAVIGVQSGMFVVFARAISGAIADPLNASLLAATILPILIISSGFIITRTRMPRAYLWLHYATPMKYASDAISINEFHGRFLSCASDELAPPSGFQNLTLPYPDGFSGVQVCDITTGDQLLRRSGITPETWYKWLAFAVLFLYLAFFYLIYYVVVRYFKWPLGNRMPSPPTAEKALLKAKLREQDEVQTLHSASLSWRSLEYTVPTPGGKVALLNNVNGYVQPGMLLALMGPSGAGKTTLLDVLAARKNAGTVKGDIRVDGRERTDAYARLIGYVEQFDMHFPLQTVGEALTFAANSRLPSELPAERKKSIVDTVFQLLALDPLRQALVAGLNPEESKRLSMGVELVAQPAVLFLDEPTSGLDSNGADRVMNAIAKVAKSGTSVICTIHQPSSRIFLRATHLLLLQKPGRVIYYGELGAQGLTMVQYFQRLGYSAPPSINPADFVLDIAVGSAKKKTAKDQPTDGASRVLEPIGLQDNGAPTEDLAGAWERSAEAAAVLKHLAATKDESMHKPPITGDDVYAKSLERRYALGSLAQFKMLSLRWVRAVWRDPNSILITAARALLIGFVFGSILFRRPHDQQGVVELASAIYVAAFFSFLTAFAYIPAFYIQRTIFYRERAELMYRVPSWGISRSLMDLPGILLGNFIVGVLLYWLAGLRSDAGAFFWFILTILVFGATVLVFAQMLSAVFASIEVVGLVFASTFASFALAAGFLVPRTKIRVWMRWLYWLSFLKYYLEPLAVTEFKGDTFDCSDYYNGGIPVPILLSNGSLVFKQYCPITSGKDLLKSYGFYEELQYWDVLIQIGFWAVMMLIFLVSLRFFKHIKR